MLIGPILRCHYLPPRLQWHRLLVASLPKIPLTLSSLFPLVFNKATSGILLASFMGRLRARNASSSLIKGVVFSFTKLNTAGCRFE
jgi:hypothetical protein